MAVMVTTSGNSTTISVSSITISSNDVGETMNFTIATVNVKGGTAGQILFTYDQRNPATVVWQSEPFKYDEEREVTANGLAHQAAQTKLESVIEGLFADTE